MDMECRDGSVSDHLTVMTMRCMHSVQESHMPVGIKVDYIIGVPEFFSFP